MKINAVQLEQHLTKTLANIYIIFGEDPFLVQEALSAIRKKAYAAGFTDRMRMEVETEADLENSYHFAYTPPLLGEKRLLELHWKGKLAKEGQQFLQQYAQHPAAHNMLLVRLGKLESKTEQTQWFKALEKKSMIVSIWPLPPQQLTAWIQARAKTKQLNFTPEAAQYLAHTVEGNLQAAAQEMEKLSLLDLPTITRETIAEYVADQGCFSAFDLVEQALAGKGMQVLRILHYLQNEGSEPLLILGAFTYELRTIAKLLKALKKGTALPTLFSQYRVRLSKQEGMRHFLRQQTEQSLYKLFLKASEIDRLVKGALPGNVWTAIEEFSLQVAGIEVLPRTSYN